MGSADRGIRIKVDGIVEPLAVSKISENCDKEKPFNFMGKQAIDVIVIKQANACSTFKLAQATLPQKLKLKINL